MTTRIVARSISRPALQLLRARPQAARAMAIFQRACILQTCEGHVLVLATPEVSDGPLNVVVQAPSGVFAGLPAGALATVAAGALRVGPLSVLLEKVAIWEPRPDWPILRARRDAVLRHMPLVRTISLWHAPAGSLLAHVAGWLEWESLPARVDSPTDSVAAAAREAATALQVGLHGHASRLKRGAAGLAGLGIGLTPAGDDFLVGAMLWAWLVHPQPGQVCEILANAAAPRTTALSAALLRAAARGEVSALWHRLLAALETGAGPEISGATMQVLAQGATSGADALAGFLFTWAVGPTFTEPEGCLPSSALPGPGRSSQPSPACR